MTCPKMLLSSAAAIAILANLPLQAMAGPFDQFLGDYAVVTAPATYSRPDCPLTEASIARETQGRASVLTLRSTGLASATCQSSATLAMSVEGLPDFFVCEEAETIIKCDDIWNRGKFEITASTEANGDLRLLFEMSREGQPLPSMLWILRRK